MDQNKGGRKISDVWKYFDNFKEEGYAVCKQCKQRMKNTRIYPLKKHLNNVHGRKSDVMKYFNYSEGVAECRQCKQRMRNNRRDNLANHVKRYHNIQIRYFDDESAPFNIMERKQVSEKTTGTEDSRIIAISDESTENLSDHTSEVQTVDNESSLNMNTEKFLEINMEEQIIKSAVWGLIVDEGVAPTLLGSKNMQALIKPICRAISIREDRECKIDAVESERVLFSVANQLRKQIVNDLKCKLLSLKVDMDLEGPGNTFCVSVSFMHEGKVINHILGTIDFEDDIQLTEQHMQTILHKYNIQSKQIIYACWDDTKPKYNISVKTSEYLMEIEKIEKETKMYLYDTKIERYVGIYAQLCLLDVLRNPNISKPFLNCRNFVKFIANESNGFYEVLKQNNLNIPQLDSPWKWGSTYNMINDLQKNRKIFENKTFLKVEFLEDQFNVDNNLWLFVEAFCETFKYVQNSIIKYYTEEMHFGDYYAEWLKSKLLTAKLASKNGMSNIYIGLISSELLKCIEKRTRELLAKDIFKACLNMDPRFHHTLNLQEKAKAAEYLKKLWTKSQSYYTEFINIAEESPPEHTQFPEFNDEETDLLNKFLYQNTQEKSSKHSNAYGKIQLLKLPFRPAHTNVLHFWESLKTIEPELFFLSQICFAIPTTQNYNQNLNTNIYQTKSNTNLPSRTKDNLLTVRLNSHLLDGAIQRLSGIF